MSDELPDFRDLTADAQLLTGEEGYRLAISSSQTRKIAIYDNGVALIVRDYQYTPECKSLISIAEKKHIKVQRWLVVSTIDLEEIYLRQKKSSPPAPSLDIERQQDIRRMIEEAAREGASDIVIRITRGVTRIRTRVFGRMKDFDSKDEAVGAEMILAIFAVAVDQGTTSSLLSFMQGALTPSSNLLPPRVEMLRLQYSPTSENRGALVMRLKYEGKAGEVEIDGLGYDKEQVRDIAIMRKRTNGLYIFAGKVSSGKSTTLQRVLNRMFQEKQREISMYAIEEPVELDLPEAIQVPAKKNPDGTDGFEGAMKASLRSDPNIIVLGEIRSRELSYLAIQAVMTGHALWSTVHAGSALGILDRLTDLGVEMWKLSDPTIVRGLIYQRLTGVICEHCRITLAKGLATGRIDRDLAGRLCRLMARGNTIDHMQSMLQTLFIRGPGCQNCKLGMSGRTVVAETVLTDPHLLELYAKGDRQGVRDYWLKPKVTEGGIIKPGSGLGGIPVLHHALTKVGAGICDINEVEEEVDLLSIYERDFMFLRSKLHADIDRLVAERKQAA